MQEWAVRARGVIALLVIAPFALAALLSTPAALEGSWADFACDSAAWLLFIGGAMLRWWATLYIESRKGLSLVSEGPYSMCRNPLYFGTLMMGLAVAVYLKSLTFAIGWGLAATAYLSVTLPVEERRLRKHFGDAYSHYCDTVPRLIPRLGMLHSQSVVEVSIRGLVAEGSRALRWAWIPIVCELFDHLRAEEWWPHILRLP